MRPTRNILGAIAVLWLGLAVLLVLLDLPKSLTTGWRSLVGLVLFGPPILIVLIGSVEFGLDSIFRLLYPKDDSSWHPIFRIVWFLMIFLLFIFAVIAILMTIKSFHS